MKEEFIMDKAVHRSYNTINDNDSNKKNNTIVVFFYNKFHINSMIPFIQHHCRCPYI